MRFSNWIGSSSRNPSCNRPACPPGFVQLEDRTTPAVISSLNSGLLTITASATNDTVLVGGTATGKIYTTDNAVGFSGVNSILVASTAPGFTEVNFVDVGAAARIDVTGTITIQNITRVTVGNPMNPVRAAGLISVIGGTSIFRTGDSTADFQSDTGYDFTAAVIGDPTHPIRLQAGGLRTNTSAANGDQFLDVSAQGVTVDTSSLLAGTGTVHLAGGQLFVTNSDFLGAGSGLDLSANAVLDSYGSQTIPRLTGLGVFLSTSTEAFDLIVGDATDSTFGGVLSNGLGTLKVVKQGTGTVRLTNPFSDFSGDLTVNSGILDAAGAGVNIVNPVVSTLGNPQVATRTVTVNAGAALRFSANDTFGPYLSSPLTPIVVNGGTVTNANGAFTTLGPLTLKGGTLTNTGGADEVLQAYQLSGSVTVTGTAPSYISETGTNNTGVHLGFGANTQFSVDDVTGDANPDLIVSAGLLDPSGSDSNGIEVLSPTGGGTLAITAESAYTGTTAIDFGALLVIGPTGSLGAGDVFNDGTLAFNRSFDLNVPNAITGTGNVSFGGPGFNFYRLTGNNKYTGTTTIDPNVFLFVGTGDTTGTLGVGNVSNAGTLVFNRSDNSTVPNVVTGTGSVVQLGSGTTTVSGASGYTGGTVVQAGTLVARGVGTATSSSLGDPSVAAGIQVSSGATLRFDNSNVFGFLGTPAIVLDIAGTVTNSGPYFNTLGPVSLEGGTLTSVDGDSVEQAAYRLTGNIKVNVTQPFAGSTIAGAGANSKIQLANTSTTITVQDSGSMNTDIDLTVAVPLVETTAAPLRSLVVTKGFDSPNPVSVLLTSTNTFQGGFTLDRATAVIDGSILSKVAAVNNGSTLRGRGTVTGTLSIDATSAVRPGNGIDLGTLTTDFLTFAADSTFGVRVGFNDTAFDKLVTTGNVDITGARLDVTQEIGLLPLNTPITIVLSATALSGTFANVPDGKVVDFGSAGKLTVHYTNKAVTLTRVDVAPTSTISFPMNGGSFSAANWPGAITGTVTDDISVQSVGVSIRNMVTGLYWDGTSFASVEPLFNATALSGSNWSYDFSVVNLPQGRTYQVSSRAVDGTGHVETPGSGASFTLTDITAPTSTITFPSAISYSSAAWTGTMTGTAVDSTGGGGVAAVGISIFDGTMYWNGGAFASAPPVFHVTNVIGNTWTYDFAFTNLAFGKTYTVNSRATDFAANTETPGPRATFRTNRPPTANPDAATTTAGTAATVDVLFNDSDPDNDLLSLSAVGAATNGTVAISDGKVVYTPSAGFSGTDTFTYTASDGALAETGTVTVTVTVVNIAPVAVADTGTVQIGQPVTLDVLVNDTDANEDTLTVTGVTSGTRGAVTINPDGTVKYTPDGGFLRGTDTFTYTAGDGRGGTATGNVTVTVQNVAPVTGSDTATTTAGKGVAVNVLANDTDANGDTLTVSKVSNGARGTATVGTDGTVTYTPNPSFTSGTDTFSYTVADGQTGEANGSVFVTLTAINTAPVAVNDTANTSASQSVTVSVLGNDTDANSDSLTVTAVSNGMNGTTRLNANGTVTYTNTGTTGTDTFSYSISDGRGGMATGVVTVTVTVSGETPTAQPLLVGTPEFAVGADSGFGKVSFFAAKGGTPLFSVDPFPGFSGGVRTATADFNRDGVADVVVGTGPGRATRVRILDGKTGAELFAVDPFEASFQGGLYVAAGDVTGDGVPDFVVTPDEGGGPRCDIYSGSGFGKVTSFFGIDDKNFRGGARAAIGDISGDGRGDLLVVAGFGGGPRVAGFDGASLGGTPTRLFGDFFIFEQSLRNGVFITAGDINGDGKADVIAGGGPGGGPRVFALSGAELMNGNRQTQLANFFGGDDQGRGGIRVTVKDLDGDTRADLVVGSGTGAGSRVTGYAGKSTAPNGVPTTLIDFDAFAGFGGGVFVG